MWGLKKSLTWIGGSATALLLLWLLCAPVRAMHPVPDRRRIAPPTSVDERVQVVPSQRIPLDNVYVDWVQAYKDISLLNIDTTHLVEIYTHIAQMLVGIENYSFATAFLENAYVMSEARNDMERCFRLLYDMIWIDVKTNSLERAAFNLKAAQKLESVANKDLREILLSDASGLYYQGRGFPKGAIYYFQNAVAAAKRINAWEKISELYIHTAEAYRQVGILDLSRRYLDSALDYVPPLCYNDQTRNCNITKAAIYTMRGELSKAKESLQESILAAHHVGNEWLEAGLSLRLARILQEEKDYDQAYKYKQLVIEMRDSLNALISQTSFRHYDYKRIKEQQLQDEAQGSLRALLQQNQNLYAWILFASILSFGIFFLLIALRSYRRLQARDKILQQQRVQNAKRNSDLIISFAHTENLRTENQFKNEQQESTRRSLIYKNSLIMNSIEYANTIQRSLRPNQDNMSARYPNHFIIYRPTNLVSGDLFWFADLPDKSIFILADCSGHEVAGAALSFITYMKLNQIVREGNTFIPTQIISEFAREFNDLWKDSSDAFKMQANVKIGVLLLDYATKKVQYAGAAQSLFYSTDGRQVQRYVGKMHTISQDTPFQLRESSLDLDLTPNMSFYMMTDGFIEQPNKENCKIGSKSVLNYLTDIVSIPMEVQRRLLLAYLARHRVGMPQVDDVTLFGFSVESTDL